MLRSFQGVESIGLLAGRRRRGEHNKRGVQYYEVRDSSPRARGTLQRLQLEPYVKLADIMCATKNNTHARS